jgi:hypothetical protein
VSLGLSSNIKQSQGLLRMQSDKVDQIEQKVVVEPDYTHINNKNNGFKN